MIQYGMNTTGSWGFLEGKIVSRARPIPTIGVEQVLGDGVVIRGTAEAGCGIGDESNDATRFALVVPKETISSIVGHGAVDDAFGLVRRVVL